MNVAGIDFSTHAIDIVLLDEETDDAQWHRLELGAEDSFAAARLVAHVMPTATWWEDNGVYLIGVEIPRSQFIKSLQALLPIHGAIAACLPAEIRAWGITPGEWKKPFTGNGAATKGDVAERCRALGFGDAPDIPQDAHDAYGIAWACRQINAGALRAA